MSAEAKSSRLIKL